MKKIILISAAVLFATNLSFSQGGNLMFKQVVLLARSVTDTVPAGHVWKMEAWTMRGEIMGSTYPFYVTINSTTNYLASNAKDGNNAPYNGNSEGKSLWLPAGTIISIPTTVAFQTICFLEFEIVP